MALELSNEDKKQLKEIKEAVIQLITDYYDAIIDEDWETVSKISRQVGELMGEMNSQMEAMETNTEEYMYYIADEAQNAAYDDEDEED